MENIPTDLFGLVVNAAAGEGSEYPRGQREQLLVLVKATSREMCLDEAMIALADGCWIDGEVVQIEPFGVSPCSIEDPVIREAALKAQEGHRSVVVFTRP